MHPWFVFLHVLAVFAFLTSHGFSIYMSFAIARERDLERIKVLLELSGNSFGVMYLSLMALFVLGVIAGFTGQWWGEGWIWVSIVLLLILVFAMSFMGSNLYSAARKAAGLPYFERGKPQPAVPPAPREAVDAALARANPMRLAIIGYGGLALIAWLMMFKPF
jgi:hypothetical protein